MSVSGKTVLMTIGPTYEHLDPVRFIGNHSSGKMGFAIANALHERGASLKLVVGPVHHIPDQLKDFCYHVESAEDMLETARKLHGDADVCIFTAAVSDYRPKNKADQKIKKTSGKKEMTLTLIENPDIAFELGQQKRPEQFHVGFALETDNEEINARDKLERKHFDMIVLNSLRDQGAGFKQDTNKISIIDHNKIRNFELKSKTEVGYDIVDAISAALED